jgi:hypothetical protein
VTLIASSEGCSDVYAEAGLVAAASAQKASARNASQVSLKLCVQLCLNPMRPCVAMQDGDILTAVRRACAGRQNRNLLHCNIGAPVLSSAEASAA